MWDRHIMLTDLSEDRVDQDVLKTLIDERANNWSLGSKVMSIFVLFRRCEINGYVEKASESDTSYAGGSCAGSQRG